MPQRPDRTIAEDRKVAAAPIADIESKRMLRMFWRGAELDDFIHLLDRKCSVDRPRVVKVTEKSPWIRSEVVVRAQKVADQSTRLRLGIWYGFTEPPRSSLRILRERITPNAAVGARQEPWKPCSYRVDSIRARP